MINKYIPGLYTECLRNYRCMYSMVTKDKEFAVGFHPQDRNVFVAALFRGEGFKFSNVLG